MFGKDEANETYLDEGKRGDIFIAKYNPDGSLIWVSNAGGDDVDMGLAVTSLSDNSNVITGFLESICTFGKDEPNETILSANENYNIFIARYNPDGSLAWAKLVSGTGRIDKGAAITTTSNDSVIVAGYFDGAATFDIGGLNQTTLLTAGAWDIFFAKYDINGNFLWAKRAGGTSAAQAKAISTVYEDSFYLSGSFYQTATFGPAEPNQTVLQSDGFSDLFVALYNSDGSLEWAKRAGGTGAESGQGITTLSDNSLIVTGSYGSEGGDATFGKGEPNETILPALGQTDIFIARYNVDGSLRWSKHAGDDKADYTSCIVALSDDSVCIGGYFYNTAVFGIGEINETEIVSLGMAEIFFAKYNCDGHLEYVKCAHGPKWSAAHGIAALSDDSIILTGEFEDIYTFGLGEPNQTQIDSYGHSDIFIAAFSS